MYARQGVNFTPIPQGGETVVLRNWACQEFDDEYDAATRVLQPENAGWGAQLYTPGARPLDLEVRGHAHLFVRGGCLSLPWNDMVGSGAGAHLLRLPRFPQVSTNN
jgi:hypothetical protein